MKKYLLALACGLMVPCASAEVENNRTITKLAVDGSDTGYLRITEPLNVSCKYNVIYFNLNTDSGKAQYSMLLAAKMSDKGLSTLVYNFNTDTKCWLATVEIE